MAANDLTVIFNQLKKLLAPYAKQMEVRNNTATDYHLYIAHEIILAGRKLPECYFCGLKMNKRMVSLHFFPVYTHPAEIHVPAIVQPLLKSKSCFNYITLNDALLQGTQELLEEGAAVYRKHGVLKMK